jgi:N-hydroxyarylamine O-acetyltransferase
VPEADPIDLDRYLARIRYRGALDPTAGTLHAMHRSHVAEIPFENLDVQLGRPIRLDLESLQAKIVGEHRGGYCFEQNALFAAVLHRIGFRVTTLAARVRYHATAPTPRTHMLLKVDLPEGPFIADVGFGGDGPLTPLRLVHDEEQAQQLATFRIAAEGAEHRLDVKRNGVFLPLYAFTLEEQFPVDYELANYFTSTHPESRFVQALIAARPGDGCRYSLYNREFGIRRGEDVERRTLGDDEELFAALERYFGLRIDPQSRFRAVHGHAAP